MTLLNLSSLLVGALITLPLSATAVEGLHSSCREIFSQNTPSAAFANTILPGTARLKGSFISSSTPLSGDVYRGEGTFKGMIWPTLEYHIFRDDDIAGVAGSEARDQLEEAYLSLERWIGDPNGRNKALPGPLVHHWAQRLLEHLYQSFAEQGPERQVLAQLVREQDRAESARTVHFLVGQKENPIGHAQILTSVTSAEPLHIEAQWGIQIPGRKRGEMGRLSFFSPNESQIEHDDPAATAHLSQTKYYHRIAQLTLWQKVFTWAHHDADLDTLSFQVNDAVRILLQSHLNIPLHLARHEEVKQQFGEKSVREHIYIFDRAALREAEAQLIFAITKLRLDRMLEIDPDDAQVLVLRYSRSEISALRDTSLFDFKSVGLPIYTAPPATSDSNASIRLSENTLRFYSVDLISKPATPLSNANTDKSEFIEILISRRFATYLSRNLESMKDRLRRLPSIQSLSP